VYLAWASMQLGKWCLFCVSLYGVNIILLASTVMWRKATHQENTQPPTGWLDPTVKTMVGAGALVFLIILGIYSVMDESDAQPIEIEALSTAQLTALYEATEGPMVLDGTEPAIGDPRAPYVVVEFADYECPHCAAVAPQLKAFIDDTPDVRLLFKHYPLSQICNKYVQGDRHTAACDAAAAAECARQKGLFWEMSAALFSNQRHLAGDGVNFIAEHQIGLDKDFFASCMANATTSDAVVADVIHANSVGVHGTPALYLKGVRGDEWVRIRGTNRELIALISAHRNGQEIPEAPEPQPHHH